LCQAQIVLKENKATRRRYFNTNAFLSPFQSVLPSDTAIKIPPPHVSSALTLSALKKKTRKETVVEARAVKPDFGQADHMEVG